MATIPLESVRFRAGAVPAPEMVVVLEESATKINANSPGGPGGGVGLDLESVLSVKVRVGTPDDAGCGWLDVHVFDQCDRLVWSETVAMTYLDEAEDGSAVFGFQGSVYRGTGASPGSVWLAPDARKIQYRVYSKVNETVVSDGLLRQHDVLPDSALTHCGRPVAADRPTLLTVTAR